MTLKPSSKSKRSEKVLVLGIGASCLSVVRSLGREGINVHVGYEEGSKGLAMHSRYCRKSIELPESENEEFYNSLEKLLQETKYDLVIPAGHPKNMEKFLEQKPRWEKYSKVGFPDLESWDLTKDKNKTEELVKKCGIPYPETTSFNSQSELDSSSIQDLEYPLILKLSRGMGGEELQLVRNEKDLKDKKQKIPENTSFLAQEFEEGKIVDHYILAKDGELTTVMQAERLHIPVEGGPPFYRKSMDIDPKLENYTKRILDELNWTGVAQLEYIHREDKSFLLEINGRFWGSLPLAEAAGANFPLNLLELFLHNKTPSNFSYKKNVGSRRLVYDMSWMLQNYKHSQNDPYLRTKSWSEVISEFRNLIAGRETFDTFDLKDPLPFILSFREIWD